MILKALECLFQLKQVLPVIDVKLSGVKLHGNTDKYLFDEFHHVDF